MNNEMHKKKYSRGETETMTFIFSPCNHSLFQVSELSSSLASRWKLD